MKQTLTYFVVSFCLALLLFVPNSFAEVIRDFDVEIVLDKKGNMEVTETILYDFEQSQQRGIFREIPTGFRTDGNLGSLKIEFDTVLDEQGIGHLFVKESGWGIAKIRIGNPEVYLSGLQTYQIAYTVQNAMGFLEDIDELYWNVTGNNWKVPIQSYSVNVFLPENVSLPKDAFTYCGSLGEDDSCIGTESFGEGSYRFESTQGLSAYEGATIDLEFPKGTFIAPTSQERFIALLKQFWMVLLIPFAAWFFLKKKFAALIRRRRFYRGNPIGVEYDPGDITLLEASYFHDGKFELENIGAFIVWAAIHKHLKIEEVANKTYSFTLLRDNFDQAPDLTDNQREILNLLEELSPLGVKENNVQSFFAQTFDGGKQGGVVQAITSLAERSAAKKKLFEKNKKMLQTTYEHLAESGYLIHKKKVSKMVAPVGGHAQFVTAFVFLFLAVNPGIFLWILYIPLGAFFSTLMVVLAIVSLITRRTNTYTQKGFAQERFIKGLYKYIDMAEKDRMNTLNKTAATPELYEKLLPYAMIFSLEKKWTKSFGDLIQYNPEWYASQNNNPLSMLQLTQQMNALGQTIATTGVPRSSGSSSGSGGGGFSGGGGGGGGGGSW